MQNAEKTITEKTDVVFKMSIFWRKTNTHEMLCKRGWVIAATGSLRTDVYKVYYMYIEHSNCTFMAYCRDTQQLMCTRSDRYFIDHVITVGVVL